MDVSLFFVLSASLCACPCVACVSVCVWSSLPTIKAHGARSPRSRVSDWPRGTRVPPLDAANESAMLKTLGSTTFCSAVRRDACVDGRETHRPFQKEEANTLTQGRRTSSPALPSLYLNNSGDLETRPRRVSRHRHDVFTTRTTCWVKRSSGTPRCSALYRRDCKLPHVYFCGQGPANNLPSSIYKRDCSHM